MAADFSALARKTSISAVMAARSVAAASIATRAAAISASGAAIAGDACAAGGAGCGMAAGADKPRTKGERVVLGLYQVLGPRTGSSMHYETVRSVRRSSYHVYETKRW